MQTSCSHLCSGSAVSPLRPSLPVISSAYRLRKTAQHHCSPDLLVCSTSSHASAHWYSDRDPAQQPSPAQASSSSDHVHAYTSKSRWTQHPVVSLAKAVVHFLRVNVDKARDAISAAVQHVDKDTAQDTLRQIRSATRHARLMATVVLPLARAASSESLTAVYARTFERAAFGFAKMYVFCLFLRVLLSWFPEIDWNSQPWTFLRLITEPYLNIYRGILPPLFGQLDFTPLFGFLILQDVVEVMSPTYTLGLHQAEESDLWTTTDVLGYFNGF